MRNKEDIAILRTELKKRKSNAHIIAKIENQQALDNLDEIIAAADAVMVARGDLGVEVPFQELTFWQKTIIDKCRSAAKPVITATEMLKSMVTNPRPTRAEVSDVAHAIYDGTDAVMLSDETTIGKFPVKAVATQALIAEFNEPYACHQMTEVEVQDTMSAITLAAMDVLESSELDLDKIVCLTETGHTAQLLSRFRPHIPILALTPNAETYVRLNLSYAVQPVLVPENKHITSEEELIEALKELKLVKKGEQIILVRGKFWKKSGFTNTVSILEIP